LISTAAQRHCYIYKLNKHYTRAVMKNTVTVCVSQFTKVIGKKHKKSNIDLEKILIV